MGLLVLRGAPPVVAGFHRLHSYTEYATVFTSWHRGFVSLTSDALANAVAGRGPAAQRLLYHQGELNLQALELGLARIAPPFRGALPAAQGFADYASLGLACARRPGGLALGLRGPEAARHGLVPVAVDGLLPGQRGYPLQYRVHLLLRAQLPDETLRQCWSHLRLIAGRIAEDQPYLRTDVRRPRDAAPRPRGAIRAAFAAL